MEALLTFIVWVLCGFGCYKLAESQGRNPIIGAALGIMFGVFSVVGYLIAGKKKNV